MLAHSEEGGKGEAGSWGSWKRPKRQRHTAEVTSLSQLTCDTGEVAVAFLHTAVTPEINSSLSRGSDWQNKECVSAEASGGVGACHNGTRANAFERDVCARCEWRRAGRGWRRAGQSRTRPSGRGPPEGTSAGDAGAPPRSLLVPTHLPNAGSQWCV